MDFYTVENFETCQTIFEKYMKTTYDLDTSQLGVGDMLYEEMKRIKKEGVSYSSIKDVNNAVLNKLKIYILNKYRLESNQSVKSKTNMNKGQNVADRDAGLYGQRPLVVSPDIMKPSATNISMEKEAIHQNFEKLMNERSDESDRSNGQAYQTGQIPNYQTSTLRDNIESNNQKVLVSENIEALGTDEMQMRLTSLEKARETYMFDNTVTQPNQQVDADPKSFFENLSFDQQQVSDLNPERQSKSTFEEQTSKTDQLDPLNKQNVHQSKYIQPSLDAQYQTSVAHTFRQDNIIQQSVCKTEHTKYITINGFDRNLQFSKLRFSFPVDIETYRFRNINCIQFTKLIVPAETQRDTKGRAAFSSDFSISFPYVMLCVDEFQDVYLGTNSIVSKSMCMFVYDRAFTSANGRSYTILKPVQDEKKIFSPTPLSSLPQLNMSVQKPNGTLFNNSIDDYKLLQIEYEDFNRIYLKIVTNKYFDANEFALGDIIKFTEYHLVRPEGSPIELYMIEEFNAFINRSEGHEIVALGKSNQQGFHRIFYIYAPGSLNQTLGKIDVNLSLLSVLFPNIIPSVPVTLEDPLICTNDPPPVPPPGNMTIPQSTANIVNMSLQVTVALKITMLQEDQSRLMMQVNTI